MQLVEEIAKHFAEQTDYEKRKTAANSQARSCYRKMK
jgi:hypothetical protein